MTRASTGLSRPTPSGSSWLVRALRSTRPLAVDNSTLGPPGVSSFRSLLLRFTLPTKWSEAPESRIQCPRAAAAVKGSGLK
eukprot:82879-Heterocapsa_arctica.AAC.1